MVMDLKIVYKIALYVYKALNDSAPAYIYDLVNQYVQAKQITSFVLKETDQTVSSKDSMGWSIILCCSGESME